MLLVRAIRYLFQVMSSAFVLLWAFGIFALQPAMAPVPRQLRYVYKQKFHQTRFDPRDADRGVTKRQPQAPGTLSSEAALNPPSQG